MNHMRCFIKTCCMWEREKKMCQISSSADNINLSWKWKETFWIRQAWFVLLSSMRVCANFRWIGLPWMHHVIKLRCLGISRISTVVVSCFSRGSKPFFFYYFRISWKQNFLSISLINRYKQTCLNNACTLSALAGLKV